MGIALLHHIVGAIGNTSRMSWCGPTGKTCHRQIKGTPEEVDRTHFSQKIFTKLGEDPLDICKGQPEGMNCLRIVRRLFYIVRERKNWIGKLHRFRIDLGIDLELLESFQCFMVKIRY